jgi:hypothetical protein
VIGLLALFLALVWMLRDDKDKTRPILVFALVLNLFYGFLLTVVMGKEDGLLPWKYDLFFSSWTHRSAFQPHPPHVRYRASGEFRSM